MSSLATLTEDAMPRIATIQDFWVREFAYYLNEHRHPMNRATHMVGIPIIVLTLIYAIVTLSWTILLGGQVVGWAIQIIGHRIEGNKPALLKRPISLLMGPLMVMVEMLEGVGIHFDFAARARVEVYQTAH
ncbi:MAG: DUF962 domain-containing protein [Myxococcota bacterium]